MVILFHLIYVIDWGLNFDLKILNIKFINL